MDESYVEGNLGPVFSDAEPLSLPIVASILREKRIGAEEHEKASGVIIEACREAVDILQEDCASEDMVHLLNAKRLRLRSDGNTALNAHLAGLEVDENGFAVLSSNGGGAAATAHDASGGAAPRLQRLKPFEVIGLTTLRPATVAEAVELIPSLYRFEDTELENVLVIVSV